MSNPHPDRPIAQPKRRLHRTPSNNSVGSTGSQGGNSPLAGFTFVNPTSNPPQMQSSNSFNTGYASQSISGFGSTNVNPGFGTNNPTSSMGAFGTTNVSSAGSAPTFGVTVPTSTAPTFGTPSANLPPFGAPSANPSTFGAPPINSPFGTPSVNQGFGTAGTSPFGTSSTTSLFGTAPATLSTPSVSTAPSTRSFGTAPASSSNTTFGTPPANPAPSLFGSASKPAESGLKGFTFGSTSSTTDKQSSTTAELESTSGDTTSTTPSPFGTANTSSPFGKPTNSPFQAPASTTSTFKGFNFPKSSTAESTATIETTASPVGSPVTQSATLKNFSFGETPSITTAKPTESSTAESSSAPITIEKKADDNTAKDKPSPFASLFPKATATSSPFGSSINKPTESAEKDNANNDDSSSSDQPASPNATPASSSTASKPLPLFSSAPGKPATGSLFGAAVSSDKPSPFSSIPSFGASTASSDKPTSSDKPPASLFGASSGEKVTSLFGSSTSSDKPAGTGLFGKTTDQPAASTASLLGNPTPSLFGTSVATSSDKPAASTTGSLFGSSTGSSSGASPFTFNTPSASEKTSDKPTAAFKFNLPPSTSEATTSSNKKRDRDGDEDGPPAAKKAFGTSGPSPFSIKPPTPAAVPRTFSFGKNVEKTDAASTPTFTFGAKAPAVDLNFGKTPTTDTGSTQLFTFGKPSSEKADTTKIITLPTTSTDTAKLLNLGGSSSTSAEKSDTPKTFTFGATPTIEKTTTEKSDTAKTFTFGTPASKTTTEKQNFSFGTPPPLPEGSKSAAAAAKPTFSFDTTPKIVDLEDGEIEDDKSKFTTSKTPSFSLNKEATNKGKEAATKKVTFGSTTAVPEKPASVSTAFSSSDSNDKAPGTLNMLTVSKNTTSSDRSSTPTTLKSTVTGLEQITYKTRFWELPDDARNELALLAHFISEQTDKHDKIDQEITSSFGPDLLAMNGRASGLDTDASILGEQLEKQGASIHELIVKNKELTVNSIAASQVQDQNEKNWRMRGATENWAFFTNTIESMADRLRQFTLAAESIEEVVVASAQRVRAGSMSATIGPAMDKHRRMYLDMVGRVAELHQEVDRVVKRRRMN